VCLCLLCQQLLCLRRPSNREWCQTWKPPLSSQRRLVSSLLEVLSIALHWPLVSTQWKIGGGFWLGCRSIFPSYFLLLSIFLSSPPIFYSPPPIFHWANYTLNKTCNFTAPYFSICTFNKTFSLKGEKAHNGEESLSQKLGKPQLKTGGLHPISISDLGDRSHCWLASIQTYLTFIHIEGRVTRVLKNLSVFIWWHFRTRNIIRLWPI